MELCESAREGFDCTDADDGCGEQTHNGRGAGSPVDDKQQRYERCVSILSLYLSADKYLTLLFYSLAIYPRPSPQSNNSRKIRG